jgi:hypothetical protein
MLRLHFLSPAHSSRLQEVGRNPRLTKQEVELLKARRVRGLNPARPPFKTAVLSGSLGIAFFEGAA